MDLGLALETDLFMTKLHSDRPVPVREYILSFYRSLFSKKVYTPIISPSSAYFEFTKRLITYPIEKIEDLQVDNTKKQVVLGSVSSEEIIDADALLIEIATHLG